MEIYKLKYEVGIFINATQIKPEPETIKKLTDAFGYKQLIPNVFHEMIPPSLPQPRLRMSSSTNEYSINFGATRIAIEKNQTGLAGENLGDVKDFSKEAVKFYDDISKILPRKAVRVALLAHYFLNGIEKQKLKEMHAKFLVPFSLYNENSPSEWNARFVSNIEKKIGKSTELLNVVTQINRVVGKYQDTTVTKDLDGIQIVIDCNTNQDKDEERLDKKSIKEFSEFSSKIVSETFKDVVEKINE